MSPIVSLKRRSEPAWAQRWQPGTSLIAATIRSAVSAATFSVTRCPALTASSMPRLSLSSLLAPNPFRSRSRPSSMAADSSLTELTPSSR